MERPEAFVNGVREVTDLVELRDRARKAIPEASGALWKFFEDYVEKRRELIVKEAKEYAEAAAKHEEAMLKKHREEVQKEKAKEAAQ